MYHLHPDLDESNNRKECKYHFEIVTIHNVLIVDDSLVSPERIMGGSYVMAGGMYKAHPYQRYG